ncbi:RNA-binding protein, partial [candidate division KSB1 bacterium]|nr:RNA-binding protein [candidate division KSB1 bacterium]
MNLYIGNLDFDVTDDDLRKAFEAYGEVASAKIIMDRYSNSSRGFGFVEMPNNSEADAAVKALNGEMLKGKRLKISEARPKTERRHGGGGGGGGHRGGGGG